MEPFQVLPRLVIAGATGVLGTEVLAQVVGLQQYASAQVLAREPITAFLQGVSTTVVGTGPISGWPAASAETGVILFDPPRLFNDRERALWTPQPEQLLELAGWMRSGGVSTLVVVLPHAQGSLPEALKRGLASLDEQAVAALGFDRMLLVRSARKPGPAPASGPLHRVAHWMLSIFRFMVPASEQPVRAVKVAQFVALALQLAPAGVHIAAPETVWRAAQGNLDEAVRQWLAI